MNAQAIDHKQLAAQLTEADIAVILREMAPKEVNGRKVTALGVSTYHKDEPAPSYCVSMHVGETCSSGRKSFESAAFELSMWLVSAADDAKKLRAEAARMLAQAEELEGRAT